VIGKWFTRGGEIWLRLIDEFSRISCTQVQIGACYLLIHEMCGHAAVTRSPAVAERGGERLALLSLT
jgi:hypothetical protein